MAHESFGLSPELLDYINQIAVFESPILIQCRQETALLPTATMQIAPEQGQFLSLMVKLLRAKQVLEIGSYTGYSALAMALSLPADGHLISCDADEAWPSRALSYWQRAGVADKIEQLLGPAQQSLPQLLKRGLANQFDLIFIDADKINYHQYYEFALQLVRSNGLIILDDTLQRGEVVDYDVSKPATRSMRALNEKLAHDSRIELCVVPLGGGITLAMKR